LGPYYFLPCEQADLGVGSEKVTSTRLPSLPPCGNHIVATKSVLVQMEALNLILSSMLQTPERVIINLYDSTLEMVLEGTAPHSKVKGDIRRHTAMLTLANCFRLPRTLW